MKKTVFVQTILWMLIVPLASAQIVETHEFGETNVQWYIYSYGKTWDFSAENNMTVKTIDIKSVLASEGGTFYIEVSIQGNLVASWDQYVNNLTYLPYYHTKQVSYTLHEGDLIEYKIYGGTSWEFVGGILGINYVKLTGEGGAAYDLNFTSLSDMNSARYGFGYVCDGNSLYAVSGGTNVYPWKSRGLEKYNLDNDSWTVFVTDLIPRRFCCAEYISSQNKIYIFNGETYTDISYTDTIEIVDALTGTLSYSVSNPYPVEYCGSAVWNDLIYVFGGSNADGFSNRLYEFNPATNSWTRLPDMPEAKQTNGVIINGILYVFGGYNGFVSNRIDAYNIQNQTWTSVGTMEVGASAHAVAKSGQLIWIIGSYNNLDYFAVYDTESTTYTLLNTNMTGRRHAGAWVVGNDLYVCGGNQASNSTSLLYSLEKADISGFIFGINEYSGKLVSLINIYPNPCRDFIFVQYLLQDTRHMTCDLFSISGTHVERMIDRVQMPGKYQMEIDVTSLPAGVYFIRLQAGLDVTVQKLVVVSD